MKIAINASFLRKQNSGIGQVTVNFIKELIKIQNQDLEFFLYLEEDVNLDLPQNTASSAVKFHKVIFLPKYKRDDLIRKIWWERFALPKRIEADGCDVLLSLYQCPTVLRSVLRSKQKIKHIMVVHDIIPRIFPEYLNNWRKKIYQILTELAIKKADKIVTVSNQSKEDLIRLLKISADKIVVRYIDVDDIYKKTINAEQLQAVLSKYNLESGYIYNGGGLEVRKNCEGVLRAYKILLQSYGRASWLPKIVISGKLMPQLAPLVTDVEQLVKGLALEEHAVLLDWVPQDDLPSLYRGAKVFIYPSLYEGFGLPVLEAMNQGTPVITTNSSSLPEVGGEAVEYCNPNDVEQLANLMKKVLTDDNLQVTLSAKGKEQARNFEMARFVNNVLQIAIN